jgi:protein-disulfide isomerase-like protein with CxxC motif
MKVQGIDHQQMLELQRSALVRTNQEHRHNKEVEDINRLRKETDIKMQEIIESEEYKDYAHYEFSLVKQLKVEGYPTVFIQTKESTFQMVARGFTEEEVLAERINKVLESI